MSYPAKKEKPVQLKGWNLKYGDSSKEVSHETVKKYFDVVWNEADTYWKQKVQPDWIKNDSLYQDRFEMPFKRYNWQSSMKDPVVDNLVTRISYYIHRVLVNIATNGNYFTVTHPNKDRSKAYEELLRITLRQNNYPSLFTKAFSKSLVNAIMVHKVEFCREVQYQPHYDDTKERYTKLTPVVKGKCKIVQIDPYDIRLDPYGERYIIEKVRKVSWNDFLSAAQSNGWINIKAVKELVWSQTSRDQLPQVELKYVYTKCLTDENGEELSPNICFIVVNDEYVVHLENYILPNGRFPYSVANPMMDLYGRYGRSYVSRIHDIVTHYVGFVNLALDAAQLAALGIFEYDIDVATSDTAHRFTAGAVPGAVYPKNGQGNMLNPSFPAANQVAGLLNVGYYIDRELQNKGYVNEFFMGQATAKGRPTLGEVNLKTQESTAFFTDMASHVESEKISKDLELVLYVQLMNLHSHKDDMRELLAEASVTTQNIILALTPEEVISDIMSSRIEVTGVSGKIKRISNFNRYIQIWQVIGNMPGIQGSMMITEFVKKMFEIIDDSPDEVLDMALLEQIQSQYTQAELVQTAMAGQPPQPSQGDPRSQPGSGT